MAKVVDFQIKLNSLCCSLEVAEFHVDGFGFLSQMILVKLQGSF